MRVQGLEERPTVAATSAQGRVAADAAANRVAADAAAERIVFANLSFGGGDRYGWSNLDKGGIQHDYAALDAPDALLRLRTSAHVTIEGCRFEGSGGMGVRMDLRAQNNTIRDCTFAHLGLGAVGIFGYGAGSKDVSGPNAILRNHIHHIGAAK